MNMCATPVAVNGFKSVNTDTMLRKCWFIRLVVGCVIVFGVYGWTSDLAAFLERQPVGYSVSAAENGNAEVCAAEVSRNGVHRGTCWRDEASVVLRSSEMACGCNRDAGDSWWRFDRRHTGEWLDNGFSDLGAQKQSMRVVHWVMVWSLHHPTRIPADWSVVDHEAILIAVCGCNLLIDNMHRVGNGVFACCAER